MFVGISISSAQWQGQCTASEGPQCTCACQETSSHHHQLRPRRGHCLWSQGCQVQPLPVLSASWPDAFADVHLVTICPVFGTSLCCMLSQCMYCFVHPKQWHMLASYNASFAQSLNCMVCYAIVDVRAYHQKSSTTWPCGLTSNHNKALYSLGN